MLTIGTPASIARRSCCHGSSGTSSTPTIDRNDSTNRRRHSSANSGSRAPSPRPRVVSSFRPRFRIVSIIPGIDTGAPDRTETSRGVGPPPKVRPVRCSRVDMAARTSASNPVGSCRPEVMNSRQASVVMMKPVGTGSPSALILARPAPLPPYRVGLLWSASSNQ